MKAYVAALLALALLGGTCAPDPEECDAKFWPEQLQKMESYMDLDVNPCSDYYEYACGNWRAPYLLRSLKAHDSLTMVKADNKLQLMQHFEEADRLLKPANSEWSSRAVLHFYNSCVEDSLKIEHTSNKLKTYTEVLKQYSDWPLLNSNFEERKANASFNWEHVTAQLRRYGVQALWRVLVQPNWQASEQQIIYIAPPSFELLKRHKQAQQEDELTIFLYKRYVKYLLLDLGVRVNKADKIAAEVVEFERELNALAQNERSVVLKGPQTLATLAQTYPEINFREYFKTLFQEFPLPADYEQKLLVVLDEDYAKKMATRLRRASAETIGKYLLVQFLAHFEVYLHEHETFQERKVYCLQQTHDFLPNELSRVFLQLQHSDVGAYLRRTQENLSEIFAKLKVQFEKLINTTNVFERDAVTRVLGLEKLRAMQLLLPNLEQKSDMLPTNFDINANYDTNLIGLSRDRAKRELALAMFLSAPNATKTAPQFPTYGPLDVNAYYRLKKNAIEVPIGILRPPLYDACLPPARVDGGIGYILAHELMHGFDYDGLNYDKAGNIANNWDAKSIIKFGTKCSCYLTERYQQATLTINENIADTEGLHLALDAFLERTATPEQLKLFFLSFAQTWCGTPSENQIPISMHGSNRERVNNVLGNFGHFADVYKCKAGSRMNPEEKCRVW